MATKKKQDVEFQSVTVNEDGDSVIVAAPAVVGTPETPIVNAGVSEVLNDPTKKLNVFSPRVEVEMLRGDFYLEHATDGSAGFDVRAAIDEPIKLIRGGRSQLIPTGFKMHIADPNFMAIIVPRSGNGHKRGLVLGNSVAIIDSDYQGEWFISAWARPNRTQWTSTEKNDFIDGDTPEYVLVNPGDRIAQIIFVPIAHPTFVQVDKLTSSTERGEGGFSSTGTK